MKKILLSLLWIITLWLINFSSASFTTAYQWNYTNWQNISMSSLYNDYWEWFLCINLFYNFNLVVFDNNWTQLYSSYISQDSTQVCFDNDWSYAFFQVYWWDWTYIYKIAWQSSCPSANEICPNIKLNILDANNNIQWTWLRLTNYASDTMIFSSILYSWNLQFSQNNWNLLMTCPSSDCSYYENELNMCLNDYDLLWQDYDNLQSSYNSLSGSLSSCESELNVCSSALSSCLSGWNSELTWNNWSALFINDIQHLWKSIINITIPSEIGWDYTTDETEFNLTVSWYNQDSDYIEWLIEIQNVKPSNEDLNKIITQIIPLFVPWLLIILFIYFVFRFIKKIF